MYDIKTYKYGKTRSILAPGWRDYTTLDDALLNDAARRTEDDLLFLSQEGFRVVFYDTIEDFYLAEALGVQRSPETERSPRRSSACTVAIPQAVYARAPGAC